MEKSLHLCQGTLVKVSGIGSKRARAAAEDLVARGVTSLLSWGTAGALHERLSPGSLVLPKTVLSYEKAVFQTDAGWHRRLFTTLSGHLDLHTEALVESRFVLASTAAKSFLAARSAAIAVDMESASVARVASRAELPFMVVRVISDPSDSVVPLCALAAVEESGTVSPARLLRALVRHPGELTVLIELARNFRAARASLSAVVRLTGSRLLAP
ncbi:MAG: purine phosphorylase [Syntrophobacteria bacterium]